MKPIASQAPCVKVKRLPTTNSIWLSKIKIVPITLLRSKKINKINNNNNNNINFLLRFWRSLNHSLIPVVLQPGREYYERVAPPHSFIHAADFNFDSKKLGDYLHKVATDLTLYSSYFDWKTLYDIEFTAKAAEQMRICELCYKLNTLEDTLFYPSVSQFFNDDCKRN